MPYCFLGKQPVRSVKIFYVLVGAFGNRICMRLILSSNWFFDRRWELKY